MRLQKSRYTLIDRLFSLVENRRSSDRMILRYLFFIIILSGVFFLYTLNKNHSFATPTYGGVLKEGIVGIPRFITPALAITRADQDVVALLYGGLLKINSTGDLEPDIAEDITLSPDGKTYTVKVRKDRFFHDNTPITARDATYTIQLIQNSDLKSPLRGIWGDVTIEEVNEYEFNVILSEPYSPFIENFTVGIMPRHIWQNIPIEQIPFSQHNTEPIGSGPFSIKEVKRDVSGLISGYTLKPAEVSNITPNLSAVELTFFQNETSLEEALLNKKINSTVYLPLERVTAIDEALDIKIVTEPLPRVFGLFLNQNRSTSLRDKSAREALNQAVDRDRLVTEVLDGYGVPTDKPIILGFDELKSTSTIEEIKTFSVEEAKNTLQKGGWKQNNLGLWEKKIDGNLETLSLTIKTSNAPLFEQTANIISENWRALGVEVQVEQYEQTGLVQSVIRSRDFQTLLFGLDMNRSQELYPFWHSSQKDDPGLNISQYTNIAVDRLLEKIRTSQDKIEQKELLIQISDAISEEVPAIFLFSPSIVYVLDEEIITTPIERLGRPADRFMNVANWYAKTEIVWPIFQKKELINEIN